MTAPPSGCCVAVASGAEEDKAHVRAHDHDGKTAHATVDHSMRPAEAWVIVHASPFWVKAGIEEPSPQG